MRDPVTFAWSLDSHPVREALKRQRGPSLCANSTSQGGHVNDHDPDPLSFIRAIEENGAEFLMALGRAAGAEERDDGRIRWAIGNSPIDYHNCVVHADMTRDEADGEIEVSLQRMRAHRVPGSWHLGPSMCPPDLGARLIAHGFEYGGDDIGMAVDLSELPHEVPAPDDFVIERVRDEAGLAAWVEALGSGFGEGPVEAEWVGEMYRRLGFEGPWRHYLGRLGEKPVATATSFFGGGVSGRELRWRR